MPIPLLQTEINIKPDERAVIVGRTGCGKSTLVRALLKPMPHVVVIDPKGEFNLPHARIVTDPRDLSRQRRDDVSPILYRPNPRYWDMETYNSVYRWIYERENCTVDTDEIFAIMGTTGQSPFWLKAILTRGRSKHIRSINCTQRPFSVPLGILTEAEHYCVFRLTMQDDRKRMASIIGQEVLVEPPDRYSFWYYNVYDDRPPRLMKLRPDLQTMEEA